jgi:hypothetical protein
MSVVGQILPVALAMAALGMMPMIASVVLISSHRGTAKAWLFAAGYLLAVFTVMALFVAIGDRIDEADDHAHHGLMRSLVQLLVGVLLLVLFVRKYRKRRDGTSEEPAWLAKVDQLSTRASLGLGLAAGGANPKNLALIPSAAVSIVAADLPITNALGACAIFALVGCVNVAIPLIVPLVSGAQADRVLNSMRQWLSSNSPLVSMALLIGFGLLLIVRALTGLSAL